MGSSIPIFLLLQFLFQEWICINGFSCEVHWQKKKNPGGSWLRKILRRNIRSNKILVVIRSTHQPSYLDFVKGNKNKLESTNMLVMLNLAGVIRKMALTYSLPL
ncbi:uncharacterized protein LOC113319054 [Papaver somniferum]|uniref:uncharacterized protein LOC113319054 n=1 Tax=Papaver somniferum TaxID=3469 RepID=UPI000E6F5FC4|nr:uncharacterized protein LOC113319054 [Papaver somniferum]